MLCTAQGWSKTASDCNWMTRCQINCPKIWWIGSVKEARYHPSYYKVYTKPVKSLMTQNDTFKIDALRSTINELLASCEGHVTFINDVKKIYLKKLQGFETKNATKNLRWSIQRNCSDVEFLIFDNKEVICPNTITLEEILSLFFKNRKKIEQLKNVEKNVYSLAAAIHKELEECTYKTSWPPSCDELGMDCFPVSFSLRKFLSVICNDAAPKIYFTLFIRERNWLQRVFCSDF